MESPCPASDENIEKAAALIHRGKLVAFPTETVYGLGANALDSKAVKKIFEVKGRPAHNPLIVHISSTAYLPQVCDIEDPRLDESLLNKLLPFWPGPLSIIVPKHPDICPEVTAGADSVAVRIPDHRVARKLIELSGCPIAAPSANQSNALSPTKAEHVAMSLAGKVSMVLDGGACRIGLESTVLSLFGGKPKILRPGGITREALEQALGMEIEMESLFAAAGPSTGPNLSPGLLAKHYSPHTKLEFRGDTQEQCMGQVGFIGFRSPNDDCELKGYHVSRILSDNGNLESIAHHLFSSLQELDQMDLDRIIIDTCERKGLGEAIMDRLTRATHSE